MRPSAAGRQWTQSFRPRPQWLPIIHRRCIVQLPNQSSVPGADEEPGSDSGSGSKEQSQGWRPLLSRMFESSMTTLASVAVLGAVGYSYTRYYKHMVLKKMENAFEPGDPVLQLAGKQRRSPKKVSEHDDGTDRSHWIDRDEQSLLDDIVSGKLKGQYYLLVGEKGTGKSSMLIDAMAKIDAEGCAMFEAHADLEIFRVRLGKALDFEYHEDNIGSLFSIRGPRDASALLDIERAFNKLEKVALKRREKVGRPLIIIVNSTHLLRDDADGKDLLELVQQRAEQWAAGSLATVIFNSDDYWVYERLKQYASRMQVIPVRDLPKDKAEVALRKYREKYFSQSPSAELLAEVYDRIGGRLSFLNRVAKSEDMLKTCDDICLMEKTWFLNQCWILGEAMDDDVMDQQKYASAAMVLAKALVDLEAEMERTFHPSRGHLLPEIPLHTAREIMTRADFIQSYDAINVFTIDSAANVRADSVPMMRAFREVCAQPGFAKFLDDTLERISAIESLGRTREVVLKDLVGGGKYRALLNDARGRMEREMVFRVEEPPEEEAEEDEK